MHNKKEAQLLKCDHTILVLILQVSAVAGKPHDTLSHGHSIANTGEHSV